MYRATKKGNKRHIQRDKILGLKETYNPHMCERTIYMEGHKDIQYYIAMRTSMRYVI